MPAVRTSLSNKSLVVFAFGIAKIATLQAAGQAGCTYVFSVFPWSKL